RGGTRLQGLRVLHHRLQTKGGEAGHGGEDREGREARGVHAEAQQEVERLQLRQVKAHDTLRAALAAAAAKLGAPGADVLLERPKDTAHGDVATNLALA